MAETAGEVPLAAMSEPTPKAPEGPARLVAVIICAMVSGVVMLAAPALLPWTLGAGVVAALWRR